LKNRDEQVERRVGNFDVDHENFANLTHQTRIFHDGLRLVSPSNRHYRRRRRRRRRRRPFCPFRPYRRLRFPRRQFRHPRCRRDRRRLQ